MRRNKNNFRTLGLICAALLVCTSCACRDGPEDRRNFRDFAILPKAEGKVENGKIKVTFLGTTTLLFDDDKTQLLVDAFVSRPSFWSTGFLRLSSKNAVVEKVVQRTDMTRLAAVFVTHSHYDHALDAVAIMQEAQKRSTRTLATRPGCVDPDNHRPLVELHGSESTLRIGENALPTKCQRQLFRPGEEQRFGDFTVKVLLSKHSPPTAFNDDIGEEIERPFRKPKRAQAYKEGGSYDVLITHRTRSSTHTILVKSSANFIGGMLDGVHAEVLFLGVARLGRQCCAFRERFYEQTVRRVRPDLVVPVHWDNFFDDLTENLRPQYWFADDITGALSFLQSRLACDRIQFGLMQGYQSIMLFDGKLPAPVTDSDCATRTARLMQPTS
jgi:L-ascorbate metabolism protein UlaG (beta-lactamase superfamily)